MLESFRKIDSHSHFGKSFLGPENRPSVYLKRADVDASVIAPGACPETIEDGQTYRPCIWKIGANGEASYYQQILDATGVIIESKLSNTNPYQEVNRNLIDTAKYLNISQPPSVFVMPLHHPLLDTPEEVSELLKIPEVVALKIHGIATFCGPHDISDKIVDVMLKNDKPFVVHSDFFVGNPSKDIEKAYLFNNALSWIEFAKQTGLKILLTHGARLLPGALEEVNKSKNIRFGIAPDLLLADEHERMASNKPYLETLLASVSSEKLMYDIDYGWNVSERGMWDKLDWNMPRRLYESAKNLHLKDSDIENIFSNNAVSFFKI